jgi:hypothetical protein
VGAPDIVVVLRVGRAKAFAPHDILGGVDHAITIEIARRGAEKPRPGELLVEHEIEQHRTDLGSARGRRVGTIAAEIALLPSDAVATRMEPIGPAMRVAVGPRSGVSVGFLPALADCVERLAANGSSAPNAPDPRQRTGTIGDGRRTARSKNLTHSPPTT